MVYEEAVLVTTEYLGPAARRFIDREVEAHLKKKANTMTSHDIHELHQWCRLAIALLSDDEHVVDDFSKKFLAISHIKNRQ